MQLMREIVGLRGFDMEPGQESEHDALVKLQIERATSKQVEEILEDFKTNIDEHFARLEKYLEARPTNEQMESAMKQCMDEKPLVYKDDFYDMWVKAKDAYTEKTTGKTKNWVDTAKGIAWVVLIIIGIVSVLGDSIQTILKAVTGS
jgi:hypothetical protein